MFGPDDNASCANFKCLVSVWSSFAADPQTLFSKPKLNQKAVNRKWEHPFWPPRKALADAVISNRALRHSLCDISSIWLYLNCRCAWLHTLRHLKFLQQNRANGLSSCAAFELASHCFCFDGIFFALRGLLTDVHFRRFASLVKYLSWSSF